ncbi:uncharacterized protein LAESUDRAFT_763050 [Laetiporus sulphureus 93-53]|uniref:Uncharacterized protein n=1 Tax=Laetiporus sulphureus 93-53 TaxID=1314785 RepID=A0A165C329_9APHY|nr:uncharacterized protein LAESUDRAFT_763050 [Laetiporus sulphureus 93-53]KZT02113.1 hypothetical protein LAESUDRAFT_763050 [Laetiporus sulphureus 93-53]
MSHIDGVFSLTAHACGVYPVDGACVFLLQRLDNLVSMSPAPDAPKVKGLAPPTFVSYTPFHEAVGPRCTPAELSEIMQEIVASADHGNFDNLPEGRVYARNCFLVTYIEGDLFVDRRDQTYLGRTCPIENWWAKHDLKRIPPPSAASVVIAEWSNVKWKWSQSLQRRYHVLHPS